MSENAYDESRQKIASAIEQLKVRDAIDAEEAQRKQAEEAEKERQLAERRQMADAFAHSLAVAIEIINKDLQPLDRKLVSEKRTRPTEGLLLSETVLLHQDSTFTGHSLDFDLDLSGNVRVKVPLEDEDQIRTFSSHAPHAELNNALADLISHAAREGTRSR